MVQPEIWTSLANVYDGESGPVLSDNQMDGSWERSDDGRERCRLKAGLACLLAAGSSESDAASVIGL